MKTSHHSTLIAGIDIAKNKLDIGLETDQARLQATNDEAGHGEAIAFLSEWKVETVGLEATGVYGMALADALREAGFTVVVHQPIQIKLYRQMRLKRAKTDTIDAVLIARYTADNPARTRFDDARLVHFAEQLLHVEQLREDATRNKGRLERYRCPKLIASITAQIKHLQAQANRHLASLKEAVLRHEDLARRLALLVSIPGLGDYSGLVLVIRLPELGHLDRAQIAALVGVAPFNQDSGTSKGKRRIGGGRKQIRNALYVPVMAAATRWNPDLVRFYTRLRQAAKPAKLAIIAAMRKILNIAGAILARGTPWLQKNA